MKILTFLPLLILISCNQRNMDESENTVKIEQTEVRKAVLDSYEFINNENLADSITFDQYKSLFSKDFVFGPSAGKAASTKEEVLEEWRQLFKVNKGKFDVKINKVEVSGDLAYVLYHYDETLTNIETGDLYFEVTQSAIAVLRKLNEEWKFEFLRWN